MLDRFSGQSGRSRLQTALESQFIVQGNSLVASLLCEKSTVLEYEIGATIVVQDAGDDCIHLILSGKVAIRINGRDVAIRAAGTHVGEMALIDPGARRSASVVAIEPTITALIRAEDFCEVANRYPNVWQRIAVELGNRLRERNKFIRPPNPIPVVFIGSSKESVPIVEAIAQELSKFKKLRLTPWTGDLFWPSHSTIEDLEAKLSQIDFAVLVFRPDDKVTSRKTTTLAPRDNVLLECGMFFGAIGRKRSYILKPSTLKVKIPSDIFGLKSLQYDFTNGKADVSVACMEIWRCIKRYGPK